MSRCPLCASPAADDRAVKEVISDTIPDDFDPETDHADAVRIKRAVEAEFAVTLTVTQTKHHIGRVAHRIRHWKRRSESRGEAA